MSIRLLIVDDHHLVREGLRLEFEGSEVVVVAEAADGKTAFELLTEQGFDVALVDIRMPVADGFEFLQSVRAAGLGRPVVLMHSVNDGGENRRRCRDLGAKGLLSKHQGRLELLAAVRTVHHGGDLWDPVVNSPA